MTFMAKLNSIFFSNAKKMLTVRYQSKVKRKQQIYHELKLH